MNIRTCFLAAALASGAAGAGTLDLSFVEPNQYTDAGITVQERQETLAALARHLEALAQRDLGPSQHLKLEVLDVDLIGKVRPTSRSSYGWLRVARPTDWPRFHLRYTLSANGQPLRSGDEWIKDMAFASGMARYQANNPLFFEKRMLSRWFRDEFGPQAHASAR